MPGIEKGGLKGEGARAEWTGPVAEQEFRRQDAELRKQLNVPKHVPSPEFRRPWTSLGQAPTEENVEATLHTGTA